MATAELLATAATPGTASLDFTVTTTPVSLLLKDAAGPGIPSDARVEIQQKSADSQYFPMTGPLGALTPTCGQVQVAGSGTYRVVRISGTCGVDQAT